MQDLLVKLYDLKDDWSFMKSQAQKGIFIRKPIGPEKHILIDWVRENFSPEWSSEIDTAMSNAPKTCFVAVYKKKFIGFSCYDATALGFFGPIGVHPDYRKKGTGKALLLACLLDMKNKGYGYAVIGRTNVTKWYAKCIDCFPIKDSSASLWATWVGSKPIS